MTRSARHDERWHVRQRIGQSLIVGALMTATAWSWLTVPGEQRGAVAVRSLGLMILAFVLASGMAWLDGRLAQYQSYDRRVVLAAALLPVGVAVASLLRVFLDEMFEEAGPRTLILAAFLGFMVSTVWLYRHNNGLARPRQAKRHRT